MSKLKIAPSTDMEPVPGKHTIYHARWFCSSIPLQFCLELGSPIENSVEVRMMPGDEDPEVREFLTTNPMMKKLSPRSVLPVLVMPDGRTVIESAAILQHLCETFDTEGKLYPRPGEEYRTEFHEALTYSVTECYKASFGVFLQSPRVPGEKDPAEVKKAADRYHVVVTSFLRRKLSDGRQYILGPNASFSAADMSLSYMLMMAFFADPKYVSEDELVKAYYDRLSERDSFKTLYAPPTQ